MSQIKNSDAHKFIQRREAFTGSNLYAEWSTTTDPEAGKLYIVYSYGIHWPLWIYCPLTEKWYENTSKFGPTTSKHKSQSDPRVTDAIPLPVGDMLKLVGVGTVAFTAMRLTNG